MEKTAKNKRSFYKKHRDAFTAAIIMLPLMFWWFIVAGIPVLFAFGLGFFEINSIVNRDINFVGLQNLQTFFTTRRYWEDLWRSVWLGGLSTLIPVLAGLGVSLLLNMQIKGRGFYRTIWYLPAVTSAVAVTQVLAILTLPGRGMSAVTESLGLGPVLDSSLPWSVFMIMFFSLWRGVGPAAILWLAGLQSIDPVLYEAAEIDGASRLEKFRFVTLPGLKAIATFIIITSIINSLQIFETVAFITNGGPLGRTRVLTLTILEDGFMNLDFGMAGASGLVLAVFIFVPSVLFYIYSTRRTRKEGW